MKKWTIGVLGILILTGTVYYFFPDHRLPKNKEIDKIIVKKGDRIMEIHSGGQVIKTYIIVRLKLRQKPILP